MNKVLKIILVILVLLALIPIIIIFAIRPVKFSQPQRGDVIIFLAPPDLKTEFIKRVVGLPGEKIRVENNFVYINDQKLNEPYLDNVLINEGTFIGNNDILISDGQYALFGDNRPHSLDSRYVGFITGNTITGKVLLCYSNCN